MVLLKQVLPERIWKAFLYTHIIYRLTYKTTPECAFWHPLDDYRPYNMAYYDTIVNFFLQKTGLPNSQIISTFYL